MEYKLSIPEGYQKIQVSNLNRWLSALRSGEYEQGKGKLCRKMADGSLQYCCLGVRLATEGKLSLDRKDYGCDAYDSTDTSISGFTCSNPDYQIFNALGNFRYGVLVEFDGDDENIGVKSEALVSLNDNGMPFSDIADIIETLYEEV